MLKNEKRHVGSDDTGSLDSEFEEVYLEKIEEYTQKKMPPTGQTLFAKAHKDGRYFFGNKVVKIDKEQINSKEIGEIVVNKFKQVLSEEEIVKFN